MGRRHKNGRAVNGILLFDKPFGITSNDALQKVKRLFRAQKAGHTGSLDPLADGLLPLCFGVATKISAFLLNADKKYWVRVRIGVTTTTADAEGEVLETHSTDGVGETELQAVLSRFQGEIQQIPPMYSALKHKGERLYKLAREGREVEREPRVVNIHQLELVACDLPEFELKIHCSKGTYVRTLAEDIGKALGCGAHVTALRRTEVGPYGADGMVTMQELEACASEGFDALDRFLLPLDSALMQWTEVQLSPDSTFYIRQGQPVQVPNAPVDGWVRIYGNDGLFIGVGEILDDGRVAPRRMMF